MSLLPYTQIHTRRVHVCACTCSVCVFFLLSLLLLFSLLIGGKYFGWYTIVHVKNNGESTFVCSCHLHILAEHMVYWTSVQHGYMQAMCDMPAIAWLTLPCNAYVVLLYIQYSVDLSLLSHNLMTVMCMQLLPVLHAHSLRLIPLMHLST